MQPKNAQLNAHERMARVKQTWSKSHVRRQMLNNRAGHRIAVVVNDMASVNIDAELVRRGGMLQHEEKMVELSNGCICCTLREDLLTSLSSLAAENRFDHVLVESSGISEPLPVAETFTFRDKARAARQRIMPVRRLYCATLSHDVERTAPDRTRQHVTALPKTVSPGDRRQPQ